MLRKLVILLCFAVCFRAAGADFDYRIIVTTPGYMSIYNYGSEEFAEKAAKELRITSPIALTETICESDGSLTSVSISTGGRQLNFTVSESSPVVRLVYDRNRRSLSGVGFNCVESGDDVIEGPVYKGTPICEMHDFLAEDVERHLTDMSLLSEDTPTVFLFEVDIDENGVVQRIVELNGAYKQYSKIIMDRFYDKAFRGWEPAKVNGVPCRALAHFAFELKRMPVL